MAASNAIQMGAGRAVAATKKVAQDSCTRVNVPILGEVVLPGARELGFVAGIGVLALAGAVEWPVAVVISAGHLLARHQSNKALPEFGEAIGKA
jgi:hypothetical protein